MKDKISVFGATGFVGSAFCELYSDQVLRISRDSRNPESDNVLYLISTVHNYNVFSDVHLDINTNLSILMDVLEKCKENKNTVFKSPRLWTKTQVHCRGLHLSLYKVDIGSKNTCLWYSKLANMIQN